MKIDWKKKLTSRKFWAAVIGVATSILVIFKVPDADITQITGLITTSATLIAYIIGEGMVDAAREGNSTETIIYKNEKESEK